MAKNEEEKGRYMEEEGKRGERGKKDKKNGTVSVKA